MIDRKAKLAELRAVEIGKTDPDSIVARAHRSGRKLAEFSEDGSELIGYFTIGVYSDGQTCAGWSIPEGHPTVSAQVFKAMVLNKVQEKL